MALPRSEKAHYEAQPADLSLALLGVGSVMVDRFFENLFNSTVVPWYASVSDCLGPITTLYLALLIVVVIVVGFVVVANYICPTAD